MVLSKILKWTWAVAGLVSLWHGLNAAIWLTYIALSHGGDAMAWVMALKESAWAVGAGYVASKAGRESAELGLPDDEYYDRQIEKIDRKIDTLERAKAIAEDMAGSGGPKQEQAIKDVGKHIGELEAERAAIRQKAATSFEEKMQRKGGPLGDEPVGIFGRRQPEIFADLEKMFAAATGTAPGVSSGAGTGATELANALGENADATDRNTDQLNSIVAQIIGGGDLAKLGIAPVEVARMKGYTDPVGRGGSVRGDTVTINLPPGLDQTLKGAILDIAKTAIEQYISGSRSYSTARTEG